MNLSSPSCSVVFFLFSCSLLREDHLPALLSPPLGISADVTGYPEVWMCYGSVQYSGSHAWQHFQVKLPAPGTAHQQVTGWPSILICTAEVSDAIIISIRYQINTGTVSPTPIHTDILMYFLLFSLT